MAKNYRVYATNNRDEFYVIPDTSELHTPSTDEQGRVYSFTGLVVYAPNMEDALAAAADVIAQQRQETRH